MATHSEFGVRLKVHTASLGEPQAVTAQRAGVTPSYVSQLFRGRYNPSRELAERIIGEYGLPREEWLALAGFSPLASREHQDGPAPDAARALMEQALMERALERAAEEGARRALALLATQQEGRQNRLEETAPSPKEQWVDGLAALYQEFQRPIPVSFRGGLPETHEEVALELADLRRQLEEGLI